MALESDGTQVDYGDYDEQPSGSNNSDFLRRLDASVAEGENAKRPPRAEVTVVMPTSREAAVEALKDLAKTIRSIDKKTDLPDSEKQLREDMRTRLTMIKNHWNIPNGEIYQSEEPEEVAV